MFRKKEQSGRSPFHIVKFIRYMKSDLFARSEVHHFHPCSSNWYEAAFLNVLLNLGEESRVPALYPLELLGLNRKQRRGQS